MPRRPFAFGLSLAVHAGLIAVIAVSAPMSVEAGPHTIQLNGTRQERQAGRDLLHEVLRGDGMPIRLTSPAGDAAAGLAWWSPGVGLWLAVDLLALERSGQHLQVALQVGDESPTRIGPMAVNGDGSGRIVAGWIRKRPAPGTPVTLTVFEAGFRWSRRPSITLLTGTSAMRR